MDFVGIGLEIHSVLDGGSACYWRGTLNPNWGVTFVSKPVSPVGPSQRSPNLLSWAGDVIRRGSVSNQVGFPSVESLESNLEFAMSPY